MGSTKLREDISSIEATAARWVVRLRDDPPNEQAEIEFDEWLAQSAEHRACYMRCEMAMALARELEGDRAFKDDLAVCAASFAAQSRATTRRESSSGAQRLHTAVGEQRTITLADRSVVTLNTDTSISVLIDARTRRVDLHHGEALFSVSHDPSRAFDVWAAGGKVRAVGTRFSVGIDRGEVTVSVLEGAVIVSSAAGGAAESQRVRANESVRYAANGRLNALEAADVRRINAWSDGKLVFDQVPLARAIAEFNRYTDRKIVLGSAQIGDEQVSGSLRIGDAESLKFLLRESLGLRAVDQGGIVLVLPATAEAETRN